MNILDNLNFDKLVDSKDMPYIKKPNDKLPKKVNLKIIDNLDIKSSTLFDSDKHEKLNNDFVIFYIETNYVNKKMIESIKKYIDKINIYIKI